MNNISHFFKKYRQAPWRVQRQWVGLFLLAVALAALASGAYLYVTSRAALAGREIQVLDADIIRNQRAIADFETTLATLTSTAAMEQRALALGFQPVAAEDIVYIRVAGYTASPPLELAGAAEQSAASVILPEYKESLFDWAVKNLQASAGGAQ